MGTSRRNFWAGRTSVALLVGGLALACGDTDLSLVDPTALDIDPPGWGGSAGQLNSNTDAGNSGGAEGNIGGSAGEAGSAGASGAAGSGEPPDSGTPEPVVC